MTIHILSDQLANKIAAGEVIERPASVVKELIENSIDAKSTWIQIKLQDAGLTSIEVTDDGHGMSEEDCKRAFMRHATSKISKDHDLFKIETLGFRGEALASIAAVSQLTIETSLGDKAGTVLALNGGKIISRAKSNARRGTKINVNRLFYNTPARLKYMKTIQTELGHITDLLNRMAFAHPNIRFETFHNGKQLFRTSGNNQMQHTIAQVYGRKVAQTMIPLSHATLDFKIEGYISKPETTRASRQYITTIINGRYIRNQALNQAILRAYHTLLPMHRYPIVVLHIKMDPVLVDVNVHPTKLEVRFSKERELIKAIEKSIHEQLRQSQLIPKVYEQTKVKEPTIQQKMTLRPSFSKTIQKEREKQIPLNITTEKKENTEVNNQENQSTKDQVKDQQSKEKKNKQRIPDLEPIGQLHGTYILAQNEEGLFIIDQHAAQERIKYECYQNKFSQQNNTYQSLLVPLTFEFSKQEALCIEEHEEKLKSLGLHFEPFGDQTYVIRSYPTWFPKGIEKKFIYDIIEQIIQEKDITLAKLFDEAAMLLACKRSIKANEYLNKKEMSYLLNQLQTSKNPFTCPHGRPIIIHYSKNEIEKMFKRIN